MPMLLVTKRTVCEDTLTSKLCFSHSQTSRLSFGSLTSKQRKMYPPISSLCSSVNTSERGFIWCSSTPHGTAAASVASICPKLRIEIFDQLQEIFAIFSLCQHHQIRDQVNSAFSPHLHNLHNDSVFSIPISRILEVLIDLRPYSLIFAFALERNCTTSLSDSSHSTTGPFHFVVC